MPKEWRKELAEKWVKKELGKLEMEKEKKGEIEVLFSEAEMLDMSLMPSEVYYPPTNLGCLATILNTITVQAFLKRLKEIMPD